MVRGLERFREHFGSFRDRYILIGGTACDLLMDQAGISFRATKDLDIVLCVEVLAPDFVNAFWDFIRLGKYKNRQKSTGRKLFYRFDHPEDESFPFMLELFSRIPDALPPADGSHLTPIPMGEAASSLSAILLEDAYYRFILEGTQVVEDVSLVGPELLIPLKAKAWLDMEERRKGGEPVATKSIKKNRNDVFRLFQIISQTLSLNIPDTVRDDLRRFVDAMANEDGIDLNSLGLRNITIDELLNQLRTIYGLDH